MLHHSITPVQIDPLHYHGSCAPCRHNTAGDISICSPCLIPSPAGHNGKYRFEPINQFPEITALLADDARQAARWAAEALTGHNEVMEKAA